MSSGAATHTWQSAEQPASVQSTLGDLLRSPSDLAHRCHHDQSLRRVVITSLCVIVFGNLVFGAVLGSFRGELGQISLSAVKLTLATMGTLVVCGPAFHAIAAAMGRPWPARTVIALSLAAAARAALVLLAVAPLLWLAMNLGLSYHASALMAACAYGMGGLAALGILLRGLGAGSGRLGATLAFVAVFTAVGAQAAWSMRPYLGRPSHSHLPILRSREGSFADALWMNAHSAAGIYRDSESM